MKSYLVRHHLLEDVLWPNGDGTFTEIKNSVKQLKELGIYNDWKLTIEMTPSEHAKLHCLGVDRKGKVTSTVWNKGQVPYNKGKQLTDEHKRNVSIGTKLGMQKNWNKFIVENRKAVARGKDRRTWLTKRFNELKLSDPSIKWNSIQKQLNAEWKLYAERSNP